MVKAASFDEEASAKQAAATEEAATQEAIAPKEAEAQAEAIAATSKEAGTTEEAATEEAAAIQGAVAQGAQVAFMQVDAQAGAMAATSQAEATEEAAATQEVTGNQVRSASRLAADAHYRQLLEEEEVEDEDLDLHYNPDAPGADTLLAEDEYPGEPPVIQETCVTNILPTKPKGSHMKTCWILVPLLHIHDKSRHGSILHDITSSLKATIRKLSYVGVEKVKVKQEASGIAHSYWLILVKPGT
jgi:hypothetical protein